MVLCEDAWIAELNARYLGRQGATNVLSFPLGDDPTDEDPNGPVMLGDVVINVQRAVKDATDAGVEPLSEVAFLLIHGICHLIGYDHEGDQAHRAPQMEKLEAEIHRRFAPVLTEDSPKPQRRGSS